jgi:hypothetical protein
MKYTSEIGSDAMIHIPSFIKIGLGIQKLMGRIHRHTDSMVITEVYFHFSKQGKQANNVILQILPTFI